MGLVSFRRLDLLPGKSAAINAVLVGSTIFGIIDVDIAAQAQTNASQNASQLPAVTIDAPNAQKKKRSSAVPVQRTRSSAATAANRRDSATVAPTRSAPVRDTGRASGSSDGYIASRSTSGTKTDTPLLETPQSISVVTRKQLDDRAVQSLTEAVGYEPGVRIDASGFDPRFDATSLRGFDITYNGIYLDGLRLVGAGLGVFKTEPYGADSITVVRGPSSALYGLGSPGGLLDITSKRPTSQPFYEVQGVVGDRSRYQGNFDFSGPLDADGKFSYRLTGLARDADLFVPGGKDNRLYIAPAFTWRPDTSTSLTFLGAYQKFQTPGSMFTYSSSAGTTTDIYTGSPSYDSLNQDQGRIGYIFEHWFNDALTVRQKFRYTDLDSTSRYVGFLGVDPTTQVASRYTGLVHDTLQSAIVDNQVEGRFSTGPVQHNVLVGVDYTWSKFKDMQGFGFGVSDLSLLAPVYQPEPIPDPEIGSTTAQRQNQWGIYIQDQAKFDHWILTLSGRSDWVETTADDLFSFTRQAQSDQAYSGRAGLSYVFDSGVAPYVAYSTSFFPNLGVDPDGNLFRPTTGKQTEVGVKYQPVGYKSSFSAALFDLTQDGGLVVVSETGITLQRGEIQSRGLELQALANLGVGLDVTSSYTYLDLTTLRAADAAQVGKQPSGNPPHTFALWANYALPTSGHLAGLSFGAGVRHMSSSYGDDENTFKNSALTLFDAALKYDLGRLSTQWKGAQLQINAKNVFDKRYTTCQTGFCYRGAPMTVMATLGYRW